MKLDLNDVDIRVIDQRIGMGVGGLDTVVRAYHKPSGVLVVIPRMAAGGQHGQRQLALDLIEYAILNEPEASHDR